MAKNKRLRGKVDKPVSPAVVRQRSREQQYAAGKAIRDTCPRESQADWKAPADRSDPVEILEASNKGRLPELIPVRYGRENIKALVRAARQDRIEVYTES